MQTGGLDPSSLLWWVSGKTEWREILDRGKEVANLDPQGRGKPNDMAHGAVALPAFNSAVIRTIQPSCSRKVLL